MQTLPETAFQMLLYWLIEWHVTKWLVLPWQQLIWNLTRDNSANENVWSSVSWLRFDLTWHTLVKQKLEFNLLPSYAPLVGVVQHNIYLCTVHLTWVVFHIGHFCLIHCWLAHSFIVVFWPTLFVWGKNCLIKKPSFKKEHSHLW